VEEHHWNSLKEKCSRYCATCSGGLITLRYVFGKLEDERYLGFCRGVRKQTFGRSAACVSAGRTLSSFYCSKQFSISVKDSFLKFGAQNMYYEDSGAFTGEVSPVMLKENWCGLCTHRSLREASHFS